MSLQPHETAVAKGRSCFGDHRVVSHKLTQPVLYDFDLPFYSIYPRAYFQPDCIWDSGRFEEQSLDPSFCFIVLHGDGAYGGELFIRKVSSDVANPCGCAGFASNLALHFSLP